MIPKTTSNVIALFVRLLLLSVSVNVNVWVPFRFSSSVPIWISFYPFEGLQFVTQVSHGVIAIDGMNGHPLGDGAYVGAV